MLFSVSPLLNILPYQIYYGSVGTKLVALLNMGLDIFFIHTKSPPLGGPFGPYAGFPDITQNTP